MNDEIREILDNLIKNKECLKNETYYPEDLINGEDLISLLDYITNLQNENQKLKEKLNCKEYFSSTMPEDTEFVILTKNNYDRQQKDIQLELIDYKSRVEKATEKSQELKDSIDKSNFDGMTKTILILGINQIQNILQNGSEK